MIVTLDFETFFSDTYTLSKMTTEEYIRDPRFEVHGCGIKWGETGATKWYDGEFLKDGFLQKVIDKADGVLCHHAQFDGLILSHHYGVKPKFWLDTLSMARLLLGNHLRVGLEPLAHHFKLEAKNVPYNLFRGKHWAEIQAPERQMVADGCCHDVDLTWDVFERLAPAFPQEEYALVDATVRMFTEPVLVGDTSLLAEIWQEEAAAKAALLAELGVTGDQLRSNAYFAELLRAQGVEPAVKDGKNGPIYAFASTDQFMRDLMDDEDETVAMLAEARMSEKSTLVGTRTSRLGFMSTRGAMCVYEAYAAAHTSRWGGGDKTNYQNFPRPKEIPEGLKPTERQIASVRRAGRMGKTQRAPAGHLIITRDASQIECRILNRVAGQADKVEDFRMGRDPYIGVASAFYGYEVNKKDHPEQRQVGKVLELQCGYGSGAAKIVGTLRKGGITIADEDGLKARDAYRGTHPMVTNLWDQARDVLSKMHSGLEFEWGCFYVKNKRIYLPTGIPLIYETLEWHETDTDKFWRIYTRDGWKKTYGAKLVENVIQALARLHVSQSWLRCREAGVHIVSMEHDKLIGVVREAEAEDAFEFMGDAMSVEPAWLPGLPLDSEGYISDTFAKPEKTP